MGKNSNISIKDALGGKKKAYVTNQYHILTVSNKHFTKAITKGH